VTDYRRFTAMINEYYSDPEGAIAAVEGDDDPLKSEPASD